MDTPEINIADKLKYCPAGMKLYSPCFGFVIFDGVDDRFIYVIDNDKCTRVFFPDGTMNDEGECMLFPSKEQRNWSRFEPPVRYFIDACGTILLRMDAGTDEDAKRSEFGNEFNTREEAEYAAEKVRELLLSLRKEEEKK